MSKPAKIADDVKSRSISVGAAATGARAIGASAIGGALSMGAVVVGTLAVARLRVGRATFRDVRIDKLSVGSIEIDKGGPNEPPAST